MKVTLRRGTEAVGVARSGLLKGAMAGRPGTPFRVLVARYRESTEEEEEEEEVLVADAVVDATGTCGARNWLGRGGLPARGERRLSAAGIIRSSGVK